MERIVHNHVETDCIHMDTGTLGARDRLILSFFSRGLHPQAIRTIRMVDVVQDTEVDFLEAREHLFLPGGRGLALDDALRGEIEDYVNAAHQGRPFVDYRPDIGPFLFPSASTGDGLTNRRLNQLLRHLMLLTNATTTTAPVEGHEEEDEEEEEEQEDEEEEESKKSSSSSREGSMPTN